MIEGIFPLSPVGPYVMMALLNGGVVILITEWIELVYYNNKGIDYTITLSTRNLQCCCGASVLSYLQVGFTGIALK